MTVHAGPTVVLLVGALALLVGSAATATRGLRLRRTAVQVAERAVSATAEVLELSAKDVSVGGDPTTLYYPTVRFTPEGGGGSPPPHAGDRVEVRFDPEHPSHVELADVDPLPSAGRSSFVVARLLVMVALALPVAWLLLALLVWE